MKSIGGLMVLFGAGSIVLGFIGYEFTLMMWVDNWGPTVGWIIRGALIVVGGALWLMGAKSESEPESDSGQLQESDAA